MGIYRKRPDTITAVRFDATSTRSKMELLVFLGGKPGSEEMPTVAGEECYWDTRAWEDEDSPFRTALVVPQGSSFPLSVQHEDWLVRHPGGQLQLMDDATFTARFEEIEPPAQPMEPDPAEDEPPKTEGNAETPGAKGGTQTNPEPKKETT